MNFEIAKLTSLGTLRVSYSSGLMPYPLRSYIPRGKEAPKLKIPKTRLRFNNPIFSINKDTAI